VSNWLRERTDGQTYAACWNIRSPGVEQKSWPPEYEVQLSTG